MQGLVVELEVCRCEVGAVVDTGFGRCKRSMLQMSISDKICTAGAHLSCYAPGAEDGRGGEGW